VSEWREAALGDVLDIVHGYAFKGENFGQGRPYRLVTPGNFYEKGGFRDRGPSQKTYDGPIPDGYVLPPDSLIVAMTEQAPGLLGSSGLVPADGQIWLHNQRIGRVRIRDGAADKRFLYYLFNEPSVRAQVNATATGTKVRHTAPGRIQAVKVRLPPTRVQRRIAAVLSAFDERIEINERRIELLQDVAGSLYREWFVRFRFPGHEDVELVDSELGPIPSGWAVCHLGASR
jgi:type I restriction enzyme S subunit